MGEMLEIEHEKWTDFFNHMTADTWDMRIIEAVKNKDRKVLLGDHKGYI